MGKNKLIAQERLQLVFRESLKADVKASEICRRHDGLAFRMAQERRKLENKIGSNSKEATAQVHTNNVDFLLEKV